MQDFFIAERFRLDGVVTAVDAVRGAQLQASPEAVKQAAMADRLLITKCDQACACGARRPGGAACRLNPGAPQCGLPVARSTPPRCSTAACGTRIPIPPTWPALAGR